MKRHRRSAVPLLLCFLLWGVNRAPADDCVAHDEALQTPVVDDSIDKRAASVLNLPPPNVGGLTEARKIAALAEIRGMQIAPHFFSYGPLCWVAMANLCMATPNVLILEANSLRESPSRPKGLNKNQFFKEPIKIDGYYFVPSGKPGLGYEYDEKFVVSRRRLA